MNRNFQWWCKIHLYVVDLKVLVVKKKFQTKGKLATVVGV